MVVAKQLHAELIATTRFETPQVDWEPEGGVSDAEALVEFAGRACYETFSRPNPRTNTNQAYLRHILEIGHHGLLEHATATFYITGISRAAVGEWMRHRHFSFSQLSQRFSPSDQAQVTIPEEIAENKQLRQLFLRAMEDSHFVFQELFAGVEEVLADEPNAIKRVQKARQAARTVLPAATESRVVVTGNFRTWRHFFLTRGSEHEDWEIRSAAVECFKHLKPRFPSLFDDCDLVTLADGSEMVLSSAEVDGSMPSES